MDGWVDYLHVGFLGEHVLFSSIKLDSFWTFLLSCVLISTICFSERFLTAVSNRGIHPRWARRSRLANACWKSSLYGLVTLLRLLYMLVTMSYQIGAIVVVVIALSIGQFIIEYMDHREAKSERHIKEPLLGNPHHSTRRGMHRPGARSKPAAIFIHPYESNLARADAAALELDVAGDTDLVKGNKPPNDQGAWQHGRGRDVARELLGNPRHSQNTDLDVGEGDEVYGTD